MAHKKQNDHSMTPKKDGEEQKRDECVGVVPQKSELFKRRTLQIRDVLLTKSHVILKCCGQHHEMEPVFPCQSKACGLFFAEKESNNLFVIIKFVLAGAHVF